MFFLFFFPSLSFFLLILLLFLFLHIKSTENLKSLTCAIIDMMNMIPLES